MFTKIRPERMKAANSSSTPHCLHQVVWINTAWRQYQGETNCRGKGGASDYCFSMLRKSLVHSWRQPPPKSGCWRWLVICMHVRTADTDRSGGQDGAFKTICDSTTAGGGSVVTSATQERDPSALLSVGNSIVHLRLPPFQSLIDRKPLRQMCLRRVLFSNILCGRVDLTTDFFFF